MGGKDWGLVALFWLPAASLGNQGAAKARKNGCLEMAVFSLTRLKEGSETHQYVEHDRENVEAKREEG